MNKHQKKILRELLDHTSITGEELAEKLTVSSKTIRRNIQDLKIICKAHGAEVVSKPSVGYNLNILNEKQFNDFLELESKATRLPSSPEERVDYIIHLLLYANNYIKLNDIANELYISISRLNNDLKEVKRIFKKFALEIENKPNYGIRVVGSERNRRLCISEQLMNNDYLSSKDITDSSSDKFQIMVNNVISKVLVQENLRMSDVAVESLAIHLLIAIERIKTNNIINLSDEVVHLQKEKNEYAIATALQKAIEHTFGISLPNSEVCYLTQHLSGKKHFEGEQSEFNVEVNDEVSFLVNKILRAIFDQTRLDFYNDLDLKMNLMLHMIPFIERVQNKMLIRNPIMHDIKENYNFAYELASIGLQSVCDELQVTITEDEISYFALHFILALERKREEVKPSNVLIVCSTGRASSQLLAYQIQKHFGSKISTIKIIEAHMLNHISLDSYDFIFSTVPIQEELPIPIRYINNLLAEDDFEVINNCLEKRKPLFSIRDLIDPELFFTDLNVSTKEEAIAELVNQVKEKVELPDDYYELILEREEFASTELNNLVAIPHPNKAISKTTFIAVGILRKPITWAYRQVQILFLISIMPNNKQNLRDFYEGLVEFTSKKQNALDLVQEPTYDKIIELLEK